jgi:hypothetical protein
MADDVLTDALDTIASIDPHIRPDVLARAEYLLRERWGGVRVRVQVRPADMRPLGIKLGYLDPATLPGRTARRYLRGK